MKLDSSNSEEDKIVYKVVRLDSGSDIPGDIITADDETGKCSMKVGGETKEYDFGGSARIKILKKGR